MIIDLLFLGLLVLLGIVGGATGVIRQLHHWAGLALGHSVAKPLALVLTLMLAPGMGMPPAGVRVGLCVLCFWTFYVVGTLAAKPLIRKVAKGRERSRLDRAGGLALATAKGGVLLFVGLSGLVFFEKPLVRALFSAPPRALRESLILGLARRHNLFAPASMTALAKVERLVEAAHASSPARLLSGDPALQELLRDPLLNASLHDEKLVKAVKSGDWSVLRDDPRVAALLADPRLVGSWSDPLDYEGP